jgi:hypothetical protein
MLKAWTQTEEGNLLILGLTFAGIMKNDIRYRIQNLITIRRETIGIPFDIVLITALNRDVIAEALGTADPPIIVANHDDPIWHFVRMKNRNKVLHVCMSTEELLTLRKRPLTSFYRLSGTAINIPFDTLLVGGSNELEMAEFLRHTTMIDGKTRVEMDTIQLHC